MASSNAAWPPTHADAHGPGKFAGALSDAAWPPTHADAHGPGEFAGALVRLGDMVLDMDDLIASADAEVRALPMRHTAVIGAVHLTNGTKHPCFCLDHEQAPVLIFETVGVRTNFDAELQHLVHPIDEAVDDVMDEDVATPPHIIRRSTDYMVKSVQQVYAGLHEEYNAHRQMRRA